jgi:hypothetical protein
MSMLHEEELLSGLGKPPPRCVEENEAPRRIKNEPLRRVEDNEAPCRVKSEAPCRIDGSEASRRVESSKASRHVEPKFKINLEFCKHCVMGKENCKPFGVGIYNSKKVFGYVHSDV